MSTWTSVISSVVAGVVIVLTVIILGAGISLLLAFPVKWTWNATMPYLFSWPVLTWGKAWCLMFLATCLIKGSSSSSSK